ncbi:hypothetical protein PSHT_15859, partial [Puccinia striiformis]
GYPSTNLAQRSWFTCTMHLLVTYLKSARSVGLILYWLVALVSAPHPIKPICEWWEEGPRETPKVSLHQLFTPGWSEQHDQAEWSWEAARLLMPSALRPQSPASPSTAPTSIPYSAFLGEDSLGTQPGSRKHGQSEATDSNPASSEPASAKTNAFNSAKLSILLLRRYQDKFQQIVNTKLFHANSREWIPYDGASFGMVRRPLRAPGFVLRIFRQSEQGVQPAMVMGTLYKSLLKWIYKIHRKLLNDLEISTDVHYSRQNKCSTGFTPRSSQILTALHSWGLGSPRQKNGKTRKPSSTSSAERKMTINSPPQAPPQLVELFENEHPLPLCNSRGRPPSRILSSRKRWVLLSWIETQGETFDFLFRHQYIAADDPLIKSSISAFTGACRRQPSLRNLDLSIHPRLSTSIYFLQNTPGYGVLRIVTQQKQEAIHVNDMPVFYKRLIRAIDCIHFHVFKRLRTTGEGIVSRRRQLSYWLLRIIFNPETGLPLTGKIKLHHADLAPWEDASFVRAGDLYIILNLIEYFERPKS